MAKRFKWNGEVYEFGGQADVTLMDLLKVQQETVDLGWSVNMGEIVRLGEKLQGLTPDEAKHDSEAAQMLAINIWVAKVKKVRDSGDYTTPVSFLDVMFAPLDFEPLPDPEDHRPKAKKTAKSARKVGAAVAEQAAPAPSTTD